VPAFILAGSGSDAEPRAQRGDGAISASHPRRAPFALANYAILGWLRSAAARPGSLGRVVLNGTNVALSILFA
jgi:hypothetical protein